MKKLLLLGLAFAITVSAAFAGGNKDAGGSLEKIKKSGVIRIGVFSDKIPFGYVDEKGDYQGYDVYFARRIAKDLLGDEKKVRFVPLEAAARVASLEADKVDIVLANFTKTDERAKLVDFALPYMKVKLGLVSPDSAPITDIQQLIGNPLPLIVNKGTTAEIYFRENYPTIQLLAFDQNTEAFNALKDGRGAALAHDNTEVFAWAILNAGFSVPNSVGSIGNADTINPAVRKGNAELLNWLNDEIANKLGDNFFHEDYKATLEPVYGNNVDPEAVVVEKGVVR
jgi:polar amino acid transport system substrate-binding protein